MVCNDQEINWGETLYIYKKELNNRSNISMDKCQAMEEVGDNKGIEKMQNTQEGVV